MSRRSWSRSVRHAALTATLVCGLGWAAAHAQVAPIQPDAGVAVSVDPTVEQGEVVVEPETPSPWSIGLVTSTVALAIGGLSSVLGIWVHRDQKRPLVYAGAMSALIASAVSVGLTQGYLDATSAIRHEEECGARGHRISFNPAAER